MTSTEWRARWGRTVSRGGVLRWDRFARPETFSSGRGRSTRAGTGILFPTASTVPVRKDTHPAVQKCPRRRRLSPAGRARTRPYRNVPGRAAQFSTASNAPGPTSCHPEAASARANQGRATTRARTVMVRALGLERVTGIEPALSAWEAEVLPLNYTRVAPVDVRPRCVRKSNPDSGRLRKSACGGSSRTASATPSPTTLANGFPDVFISVVSA